MPPFFHGGLLGDCIPLKRNKRLCRKEAIPQENCMMDTIELLEIESIYSCLILLVLWFPKSYDCVPHCRPI